MKVHLSGGCKAIGLSVLIGCSAWAQQSVSVSGSVKNEAGVAIGGAAVYLMKLGLSTGTTANGTFAFSAATPTTPRGSLVLRQHSARLSFARGALAIEAPRAVEQVWVRVVELSGRQLMNSRYPRLFAGTNRIALPAVMNGATQPLVIQVTLDGEQQTLLVDGMRDSERSAPLPPTAAAQALSAPAAAVDTLRIEMGGVSTKVPISSYSQSNIQATLAYVATKVAPLPSKTMAEQNAAKQYFKGLGARLCGFVHKDGDVTKDVIGFVISDTSKARMHMDDADMERLLHFPKLQMVWIQHQNVGDSGIKVLQKFPDLVDVRFHYMNDGVSKCSKDFLKNINMHRNLRVLEIKHCFSMPIVDMSVLDGFPYLTRLVLDNGAATAQGLAFARKCPSIRDLSWHRGTMKQSDFAATIAALPNLQHLLCRSYSVKEGVPATALEPLRGHTTLESLWLVGDHFKAMVANEDFLMPLVDIPTLKTLHANYEWTDAVINSPSVTKFREARSDVNIVKDQGYIDLGYILRPDSDLNDKKIKEYKDLLQ